MFNYRDSLQILVDINLILIISISIISSYLYLITKNIKMKLINYIYLVDFIIYAIFLNSNYTEEGKIIYILSGYIILKSLYYLVFRKTFNITTLNMNVLIIINLIQIISLYVVPACFFSLNIFISLLTIKEIAMKHLNNAYKKLNKNMKKINTTNSSLYKIDNEINKEKLFQEDTKHKIAKLESKTNKAISEVDMPVFILNMKNEIKDYNESFTKIFKTNKQVELLDIFAYIEKKFINSYEFLELIKNVSKTKYKTMDLYTVEEDVYKFTCIKNESNDGYIKICILNDITQSNIIQKKLRESEEKYRKLMDLLSDGVIIHDINNVSYINESAINLFGLKSEFNNTTIDDIKEKIDSSSLSKFIGNIKFVNEDKKQKISNKIKTKDGLFIEFITTRININNTNMLLSIAIDITTMEKSLRELDESKKTYKMLMQNIPEGVVVIDKKTKNYLYQNRAMIRILKQNGIDSISKIINDYIKDENYGISKKYKFKNSAISSVSLTIIDTKDENQLVGIIRGLDEEERIKRALEELDSINIQYEVKNDFLITISQNLKSPISTIATANNLLDSNKSKYKSKYINNYTKLIKRNCYRLQRLINNMNEIVEVENGFYSMDYINCDIVKFIKNIVCYANKYLEDKNIKIEFETFVDKSIVKIDPDKIERIILNLLSNAIKFSEAGSPIKVSISENHGHINISVEDKGFGIPNDKLNFIFTKFAQVDKTLSRNAEGSGVGLSLVRRLIELHNGKIKVESKEGIGSKFTIMLRNNTSKLKESKNISKIQLDDEKMHIEFADIYF